MKQEINDIKELTNDDLLNLHSAIQEHIKYLSEQIITLDDEKEEDIGGDSNE